MAASIRSLQGGTRLLFDSVQGVTNTVERMHESIARQATPWRNLSLRQDAGARPGKARPGRAHGIIASAVYATIRGINGTLREGVDASFELFAKDMDSPDRSRPEIRLASALNGAFGDHLEDTGNALAIPMQLLAGHAPLQITRAALACALPQASPHLVVLVHGLGLSELSWQRKGAAGLEGRLQEALQSTTLSLRYNSGRHISTNGREFAQLLQQLCEAWPVPVESLSLVGHSMGGLVIRSACWYAAESQADWLQHLQRVVCLGTPHHGAPLEKAGHAFNAALQKLPYTEALTLGRRRSAGVKDLQYGDLLDEDWQPHHPDMPRPDTRKVVPLLPEVDYYFAAATVGRHRRDTLGHILGDLLVRLDSAVGIHADELRQLNVKPENCRIFHDRHHFDLLSDQQVQEQIIEWLHRD